MHVLIHECVFVLFVFLKNIYTLFFSKYDTLYYTYWFGKKNADHEKISTCRALMMATLVPGFRS